MLPKFYQNRLGIVEDMTKTFWCVFFGSQCTWARHTRKCIIQVSNEHDVIKSINRKWFNNWGDILDKPFWALWFRDAFLTNHFISPTDWFFRPFFKLWFLLVYSTWAHSLLIWPVAHSASKQPTRPQRKVTNTNMWKCNEKLTRYYDHCEKTICKLFSAQLAELVI